MEVLLLLEMEEEIEEKEVEELVVKMEVEKVENGGESCESGWPKKRQSS